MPKTLKAGRTLKKGRTIKQAAAKKKPAAGRSLQERRMKARKNKRTRLC